MSEGLLLLFSDLIRVRALALALVLIPALAGCQRSPIMADGGQPSTLVDYSRSGGFAGLQDRLVIDEAGKASVRRRDQVREYPLDPTVLDRLKKTFESAGLDRLQSDYPARGADLFTYRITYRGRTVTAMDSAVPSALEPVIRMLNEIIDSSGVSMR